MEKILEKIIKNKKTLMFSALLFFCFFPLVSFANDDQNIWTTIGSGLSSTLGWTVMHIVSIIASIFNLIIGNLVALSINILVEVASFDNIIDVPSVQTGWVIVRDLCNMFIVLILLFIAFATILRLENYSAKKALPTLLIFAVLINFSRTIFGLIVDFSQIIMLAFIHPLAEANGSWFVEAFNTKAMLSISTKSEEAFKTWETAGAIILGMFAGVVTLIVVLVLLAVLIIRLILLWVYTILSPLIFLGFAFPPLQKYVGSMWQDFIKQVMVGPLLAFFIWLALTTAHQSLDELNPDPADMDALQHAFFQNAELQKFMIVIALLIGGLIATQQIGGAVGQAAGRGMAAVKKSGLKGARIGQKGAKITGQAAGRGALTGGRLADKSLGSGIDALSRRVTGGRDMGLREKGVVGGTVGGAWNAPTNLYKRIATEVGRNEDLNKKRYDRTREYEEKGYVEKGNKRYDRNDRGEFVASNGEILKDDDNNPITAMNKARKAWHESLRDTYSRPRAAQNKAEKEKLDQELQNLRNEGRSKEELSRIMSDATESNQRRQAAAMAKAHEGEFKDHDEFSQAKKLTQNNSLAQKEIKDKTYEKQPHIVHDLRPDANGQINQQELNKFIKDVDKGKLSLANAPESAKKNFEFTKAMEQSLDESDFKEEMNKAWKNGSKKLKEAMESNLNELKHEKRVGSDDWQKNANLHADLTGKARDSFSDRNGSFRVGEFGQWISNANANKLDNLDEDQVEDLMNNYPGAGQQVRDNTRYSHFKAWSRKPDKNVRSFRALRDQKTRVNDEDTRRINNDAEVSSV